jgi:hypothetical protein
VYKVAIRFKETGCFGAQARRAYNKVLVQSALQKTRDAECRHSFGEVATASGHQLGERVSVVTGEE